MPPGIDRFLPLDCWGWIVTRHGHAEVGVSKEEIIVGGKSRDGSEDSSRSERMRSRARSRRL
jgi:hypothetical protein